MASNKVYFEMSYGINSVHHLEHHAERRFLFFKKHYAVGVPVWNDPLPDEQLSGVERTVHEALSALNEKYKYAVNGAVEIHPRRTSVEVRLGVEDDLKAEILHDYFGLAGVPDSFHNVNLEFLNKVLQPYGKRLDGFQVVDRENVA